MIRHETYGSACELKAAGFLYSFKFEIYARSSGLLWASFGYDENPVRRLRYTEYLVNGHYDAYIPVQDEPNEFFFKKCPN